MANRAQSTIDDTREQIHRNADDFKHRAENTAAAAMSATGDFASRVGETASDYAEKARDTASDLAERGSEVIRNASREAGRYAEEAEDVARRNPLATVAVALLAGIAIGYLSRGR